MRPVRWRGVEVVMPSRGFPTTGDEGQVLFFSAALMMRAMIPPLDFFFVSLSGVIFTRGLVTCATRRTSAC